MNLYKLKKNAKLLAAYGVVAILIILITLPIAWANTNQLDMPDNSRLCISREQTLIRSLENGLVPMSMLTVKGFPDYDSITLLVSPDLETIQIITAKGNCVIESHFQK